MGGDPADIPITLGVGLGNSKEAPRNLNGGHGPKDGRLGPKNVHDHGAAMTLQHPTRHGRLW